MMKKNRKLKVYYKSVEQKNKRNWYGISGYNQQPLIVLTGKWLQELGFEVGDYIVAECNEGKIVISKQEVNVEK